MKKRITLSAPIEDKDIRKLKAGQLLYLKGIIYTARDQAHRKLAELIKDDRKLPLNLKNQIIYYTGPTPRKGNSAIGSCGPTTSLRMDKFTPYLLRAGVRVFIGKGQRSKETIKLLKKYKAVYLVAPAGCGAYLSEKVKKASKVAFKNLGPEAMYRFEVDEFPTIVCVDTKGGNLYS
jgi:fumarate hydratase subunit beta